MNFNDFVLAGTTYDLQQEPAARDIADAVEYRMDLAEDPLGSLASYSGELPIIASNHANQTENDLDHDNQIADLTRIAEFDSIAAIETKIDVARQSEGLMEELSEYNVDIIVSYYNFDSTPTKEELLDIIDEAISFGDIVKIDVMAEVPPDAITLLSVVEESDKQGIPISGTSLGDVGSHTRIIAPLYGSRISYAPIDPEADIQYSGKYGLEELQSLIESARYEDNEIELHEKLASKSEFQNM